MSWNKAEIMYEGKGKRIFAVQGEKDHLIQEFKDQLTAFNAEKKAELAGKGALNCLITRENEGSFRKVHLARDLLQQVVGKSAGIWKYRQRIAFELSAGKNVELKERISGRIAHNVVAHRKIAAPKKLQRRISSAV